jgi:predicted phage baseplate assembly protein
MPLPKPTLDNRRFDQLVAECRGLLVRSAPGWTDHNVSDPGITLLELGAWLGEQNIYRLDRLSAQALRTFVRLVGIEPRTPGVAQTVVALHDPGGTASEPPSRVRLADARAALFETTTEVFVSPAQLVQLGFGPTSATTVAASPQARAFPAFGPRPRPGHALYLGFDRALDAPGATLSLHVWTDRWEDDAATRAALQAEDTARAARDGGRRVPTRWNDHYRVRTLWEYRAANDAWLPLQDVDDETRALTLSGFVRFAAPGGHAPSGARSLYFIRCRIVSGRFECPPYLLRIAFNAVACEHALSRARREIGVSRGHAGALFSLGEAPIVAGTTSLHLVDHGGHAWADWHEVPDWDRAGAHDRVFRLDPESGEIQSGDGLRGEILPAGFRLLAAYRLGGGPAGNIAAGTLANVPLDAENLARAPALASLAAPLEVLQPFAATGGSAADTIAGAQARAFDAASRVEAAVTPEDIERLALATPGVPVARVRALANMDPILPCAPAPGVTTLVVIPRCALPAPRPSAALLDAVARYVGSRRLVTSELRVIGPAYRRVAVQAVLHVACNADPAQVLRSAAARIVAYFDPLSGGADGSGWPFGRTVYRGEILALLAATSGVQRVTGLGFVVGHGRDLRPICDNVPLCPNELVRSGRHRLRVESEVARGFKRSEPHECEPH